MMKFRPPSKKKDLLSFCNDDVRNQVMVSGSSFRLSPILMKKVEKLSWVERRGEKYLDASADAFEFLLQYYLTEQMPRLENASMHTLNQLVQLCTILDDTQDLRQYAESFIVEKRNSSRSKILSRGLSGRLHMTPSGEVEVVAEESIAMKSNNRMLLSRRSSFMRSRSKDDIPPDIQAIYSSESDVSDTSGFGSRQGNGSFRKVLKGMSRSNRSFTKERKSTHEELCASEYVS